MKQSASQIKLAQSIAQFYEDHGAAFAATRGQYWDVMKIVSEACPADATIIDVGAGNGRLLSQLPSGIHYIGIEPSSSLRHFGELASASHPSAAWRNGALPTLPATNGEADLVVCLAVLHHVPGHAAQIDSIKELSRILKPGGLCILTAWNFRSAHMFSWTRFLAAWLRFPLVRGGSPGDLWMPWKAEGANAQRFVHAFTLSELRGLFSPENWHIERAQNIRSNLMIVARKK